jgi:hypothetical protein
MLFSNFSGRDRDQRVAGHLNTSLQSQTATWRTLFISWQPAQVANSWWAIYKSLLFGKAAFKKP